MSDMYILDENGNPKPVEDVHEWGFWFEKASTDGTRIVKQDYVEGEEKYGVSTVFLGLDHSFKPGAPPVLWETLVFGGRLDGEMRRYTSKEAAIRGHEELLAEVAEDYYKDHPRFTSGSPSESD